MAIIQPFRALRPPVEKAAEVASVPYDVVNTDEARQLAARSEWSFLHVSRPEIDLPDGTDLYSNAVYQKAAENFARFQSAGALLMDAAPRLFVYRQIMGAHAQTGVVACASVDEYDGDLIKKHEKTRPDKEDDRTRHILALRAQTGPVFLTYRGRPDIDTLVAAATETPSLYDFTAPDGIRHTVWSVDDTEPLQEAFRRVKRLYIADGHHRAASASRARAVLRERNPGHTGREECNSFLAVLFPAEQLQILPYNRVVKDLGGLSPEGFLARVREQFTVTEDAGPQPTRQSQWRMYLDGRWYGLERGLDATVGTDPVNSLDVSILQDNLLAPVLNIHDVRTDKRIDFVGGIRGTEELERLVDSGRFTVAFSLYPTTVEDLMRVSDVNGIMPPKSTWFEPKLRDALLIHCI
jgi:uncharacterized protein (DUF1015 family)